ncbi:unnamed protein product [Urochloa decumbens]|uniref:DUF1618 domain-containing protein n=1 Tax=Urochloa decumbens TaxID=240449 RepID=A0ABC8X593_9POAL
MAKRRAEERCGGRAAKRRAVERGGGGGCVVKRHHRRHLYLLLDDWASGYSIRKVDLPSDDFPPDDPYGVPGEDDEGDIVCNGDHRLPPAIFRVEAQRGLPTYFAAAFDSKILAMHPISPATALPSVLEHRFPIFDVRTRSCLFGPRMETTGADPIYIPAGRRLFALAAGTFDWLDPPPPLDTPACGKKAREWYWLEIADPPFKRKHVTSYAVHPDGQTIFVSIKNGASAATFSFETEEHGGIWNRHGKWALPFDGRAHYDAELDAWVGLSGDPDSIGYLCSCDTVPAIPDSGGGSQCPARKLSKEKLFSDDPTETHIGATLVYMGGRSEFCLVQCVSIKEDYTDVKCCCGLEDEYDSADERNCCHLEEEDYFDDDLLLDDCGRSADERKCCDCDLKDGFAAGKDESIEDEQDVTSRSCRYLFRVTIFHLKYDKNGDLTTGSRNRIQYYRVPAGSTVDLLSNPVAFWM